MTNAIKKCPICGGKMQITTLECTSCHTKLSNDFEFSVFDLLPEEQKEFLLNFLRCEGNLSKLQDMMNISYPTAKKQLHDLLEALGLHETSPKKSETIDMSNLQINPNGTKPSDIIRNKLIANGGRATIYGINGNPYEISLTPDGKSFACDKMMPSPSELTKFDVLVDYMKAHDGIIKKGNGRFYKFGEPECDENTVVGILAILHNNPKPGDSVFDPVHYYAAVLDWADIAANKRGYLELI